jgi:hypothetical protein
MTDQIAEETEEVAEDSSVIKTLRDQVKQLQGQLKERPDQMDIEAEVEKRVARRDAARDVLVQLGHSPKMTALVLQNLEGDPTPEAVAGFLEGIGLTAQPNEPAKPDPRPISSVADLASQVAAASAKDQVGDQVLESIGEAKSPAEIDAIMRRAGLAQ